LLIAAQTERMGQKQAGALSTVDLLLSVLVAV
jgi:hypothetical protein